MQNDLISRSALKEKLQAHHDFFVNAYGGFSNLPQKDKARVDEITNCIAAVLNAPTVDAVPVEMLGKWGKLLLPYKGDPRGPVGRMCDGHLEEEALYWGVVTDADGGRWVPVQEAVLLELIEDLRKRVYLLPTSWAHFKGTNECPKRPKEGVKNDRQRKND